MKQVIQNFKTGELFVDDVPVPSLSKGTVLVENKFSLISAGTERSTVSVGKANLLGKARQRPDLVAQVLQNIKKEGLKATLDKVKTKLDSLKALGYSTSGVVHATMDTKGVFKPGDRVACAGQDYASHAEVVAIPQNLVAKIPDGVTFEEASFTTLGAIALQGVRQANPTLGENICVIGLGLLGQITCQLLNANGCNVFGIDLSPKLVEISKENGAIVSMLRNEANLMAAVENFTKGHGFDSVIITAAAPTNDPIELSAEITKKKGKVIVVGAVKMDIPRDPHFYRKELELKLSCSYGPGRYDVSYEEEGIDYPYAYVRWTEQRNMEAFLQLLARKTINLKPLITHVFDIAEAEKAYDIVLGKIKEPHIGILLKYGDNEDKLKTIYNVNATPISKINAGFIGAGSFAQSYLIPYVKTGHGSLDTVVTTKGITAKNVAEKFGFNKASSNTSDVYSNPEINTVFIATPHNSHAKYVIEGIKANKHIFVEKPLAMNYAELEEVKKVYNGNTSKLMVGFNRRFSPIAQEIKNRLKGANEPLVMNIRVNAGYIPKDHWTQIEEVGGGRIVGEMCHFIDLMQFFTDAKPVSIFADCITSENSLITVADNINVLVKFSDGSIGNLIYVANGDKSLPKEHIEVFCAGKVGIINDFRDGVFHSGNKVEKLKLAGKGHKQEILAFIDALTSEKNSPISFESIYNTTLVTFKIQDSLKTGLPQKIDDRL
ncbi:bi-domain-containing oxidoreductase [Arenibacter troitsensis]|uniref:Polar amino acid transport system substrate-binding protein n=1 Tax=Arenibacter troitsensis TaxID=188872 RepID=A0A1X7KR49_9FLAO|nr:bi-domain-containing oxidoreductase [Arenibacter troitsensis]SMG43617.1 polar amino acid transport system substrate-binding protein [Arenibacter troitsensis]